MNYPDVISRGIDAIYTWGSGLSQLWFAFFLRAAFLVVFPGAFSAITFRLGSRSVGLQVLASALGILLASIFPVGQIHVEGPVLRFWLIVLSSLSLVIVPPAWSRHVFPEFGRQRRMMLLCYISLGILFALNALST